MTPGGDLWRPTASRDALQLRTEILRRMRRYFDQQQVLEVDTPLLASRAATDPQIPSYRVPGVLPGEADRYLNSSPEFAMKRLLANGSGSIYQICKAFRHGEQGRLHNPEFTLLEWYRVGFDHQQLMADVAGLIQALSHGYREFGTAEQLSYAQCFATWLDLDPHLTPTATLARIARERLAGPVMGLSEDDRDGWLNLLMSHCIQPQLGKSRPSFVTDYPASQAALARLDPDDSRVAQRFELFIDGVEIANGFHELRDAEEQQTRFEAENRLRARAGLPAVPMDEYLLGALQAGLPDCAGVALGLDRLLMVLLGATRLDAVLNFPYSRI